MTFAALPGLVENDFVDVADLLVGLVIDVDADELGSAPFALLVHRGAAIGRLARLVLGMRCPGDQGRGQQMRQRDTWSCVPPLVLKRGVKRRLNETASRFQWCSSMMRMISGIGIPTSQSRMGMVSLLSFSRVSDWSQGCRKPSCPKCRREGRRLRSRRERRKTRR